MSSQMKANAPLRVFPVVLTNVPFMARTSAAQSMGTVLSVSLLVPTPVPVRSATATDPLKSKIKEGSPWPFSIVKGLNGLLVGKKKWNGVGWNGRSVPPWDRFWSAHVRRGLDQQWGPQACGDSAAAGNGRFSQELPAGQCALPEVRMTNVAIALTRLPVCRDIVFDQSQSSPPAGRPAVQPMQMTPF